MSQEAINGLLIHHARLGRRVVRLKGGDPFVFGRGGEEALALAEAGIPFEIVPGVSSAVGVPAYAGIPLTHRASRPPSPSSPARRTAKTSPAVDWAALATAVDTLVILMGSRAPGHRAHAHRHGRSPETPVALIHAATTPRQETLTGTLADFVDPDTAPALPAPVVTVIGDVVALREQLGLATVGAPRAVTA